MRNCLYNKNYNDTKNKPCCGNMPKNQCCNNMMNNSKSNNSNCNTMSGNTNCNNMTNNMNCNSMSGNKSCNNMSNNTSCNNANSSSYRCDSNDCDSMLDRNCANKELMEQMRLDLQACDFAIEELALYLDTHPDDMRAVCMHNQHAKNYRKLSDEYQKVYGPLNIMYPCNSWRWLEEPWPWQRTNNCPMMQNYRTTSEENENDFDLKGGIN